VIALSALLLQSGICCNRLLVTCSLKANVYAAQPSVGEFLNSKELNRAVGQNLTTDEIRLKERQDGRSIKDGVGDGEF
jgi:hypothetical protein